jgi:hypothetical protein
MNSIPHLSIESPSVTPVYTSILDWPRGA